MNAVRILAGQRLAEPLQRLPFAESGQGGPGGLAHFGIGIAARLLQRQQHSCAVQRLPPAETADGGGAVGRVPIVGGHQQEAFGLRRGMAAQAPQDGRGTAPRRGPTAGAAAMARRRFWARRTSGTRSRINCAQQPAQRAGRSTRSAPPGPARRADSPARQQRQDGDGAPRPAGRPGPASMSRCSVGGDRPADGGTAAPGPRPGSRAGPASRAARCDICQPNAS